MTNPATTPAGATILTLWLLVSVIGAVLMVSALRCAIEDRRWIREQGLNGLRMVLANRDVREEWLRLGIQCCFVLLGLTRFLVPARVVGRLNLPVSYLVYEASAVLVFLAVPIVLTIESALAYRDRTRLLDRQRGAR